MNLSDRFVGKRGLVMGLGVFGGGIESAIFLAGVCDSVVVTDLRDETVLSDSVRALDGFDVQFRLGEHVEDDFANADVVIHSPAVRPDNRYLQIARDGGAEVTMEMSLFIESCRGQTIGITGSNGKTTTALLCYELLCQMLGRGQPELVGRWADPVEPTSDGRKVWLGGNCGEPLINRVEDIRSDDVVVLELSSFQLQDWERIQRSCDIGVVTNVTPNHLDWHRDFEEYSRAKTNVYRFGADTLILNADRPELEDLPDESVNTVLRYSLNDEVSVGRDDLPLPGDFNWSNALAAIRAARCAVDLTDDDIAAGLRRFRGVEHRLEFCGLVNGGRCFNDSIATTPESTMAALSAFDSGIHLLLGGSKKGLCFDELASKIAGHGGLKKVYVQGLNADSIVSALDAVGFDRYQCFDWFDDACRAAMDAMDKGDVFLMSPASASFYEYAPAKRFKNFENRGEHFKSLIQGAH